MKTFLSIVTLIVVSGSIAVAQKYHHPAQIMQLLNDSKISYQIDAMVIPEVKVVEYPPLLEHGLFLKETSNGKKVIARYDIEYSDNYTYTKNLKLGEDAYEDKRLAEAREAYVKALSASPENSQLMTFIGQTFSHEGNDSIAACWYQRAIDANYFDYMAHWFLADLFADAGRQEDALHEIVIAKILNRNHDQLSNSFKAILKKSGYAYDDWEFTPIYELKDLGNGKVSLKYDEHHLEWLGYGLCKALWTCEPGYKESMVADSKEHPMVVEATECVFNALTGIKNSNKEPEAVSLQAAQQALMGKMFSEYLVYDVILPKNPRFAFILTKEYFQTLSDYILKMRSTKSS